jgi:hypothetical protein
MEWTSRDYSIHRVPKGPNQGGPNSDDWKDSQAWHSVYSILWVWVRNLKNGHIYDYVVPSRCSLEPYCALHGNIKQKNVEHLLKTCLGLGIGS